VKTISIIRREIEAQRSLASAQASEGGRAAVVAFDFVLSLLDKYATEAEKESDPYGAFTTWEEYEEYRLDIRLPHEHQDHSQKGRKA
jgi:hypothetical protein